MKGNVVCNTGGVKGGTEGKAEKISSVVISTHHQTVRHWKVSTIKR